MQDFIPIRRALVSVYDKSRLTDLADAFIHRGVQVVSTGSTAVQLRNRGVDVVDVDAVTGFREILGGRVKTLHPAVHAGILADRFSQVHMEDLEAVKIELFDAVVVDLYPFEESLKQALPREDIVEKIDIGGVALLRAAAKNCTNIVCVSSFKQYDAFCTHLMQQGGTTYTFRLQYAKEAFVRTAQYDAAIASWYSDESARHLAIQTKNANLPGANLPGDFPDQTDEMKERTPDTSPADQSILADSLGQVASLTFAQGQVPGKPLRYGENAHQKAQILTFTPPRGLAGAAVLSGKPMSYNNYLDAQCALDCVDDFAEPAVAIVKHGNPCGLAAGGHTGGEDLKMLQSLFSVAFECDSVSAFGGVVACNRAVDAAMARSMSEIFFEVCVAPGYTPEALEILAKKKNLRILQLQDNHTRLPCETQIRSISGGLLLQEKDSFNGAAEAPALGTIATQWQHVTGEPLCERDLQTLEFAYRACKNVKSNAILLALALKCGFGTVGIGMGQVNRVDASHLAVRRASERARGSLAASDAFFPFPDAVEVLANAGVRAIVQPGGSVRDEEVIEYAKKSNITMYLSGRRHFAH